MNLDSIERLAREVSEINDFSEASKKKVQALWDLLDPYTILELIFALKTASEALEKIADPRKRGHSEPDAYTSLGCVMNIADEALATLSSVCGKEDGK
ncbi:unnamed protein product [Sphagnum balticum]